MNSAPLRGIEACVFDAYGTLFDFAGATRRCEEELGAQADRLTTLWRDKQLQYTWLRAAQGRHLLAVEQASHEAEAFVHFVTLLPGHFAPPQRPEVLPMSPE